MEAGPTHVTRPGGRQLTIDDSVARFAQAEIDPGAMSPPLVARLAGDEFTILLPRVSGPDEAERIAAGVVAALSEPFQCGEHASWLGAFDRMQDAAGSRNGVINTASATVSRIAAVLRIS